MYPDLSKTYSPDAIKDYKKKQVADFNKMVCKGWEQGALGGAFDPNFATNHYFYIIYNKYADVGKYHGGTQPASGKDGLLYISTDAYSQNSWDSTIFMRKILRIDVSKQDPGKMYSIPTTNPFYNATNPDVKKEIFAFGFRNTYSIVNDMITGSILGAEVGQSSWEEVNIIQPGKNYGWANGGDGAGGGAGIEGPCSENTVNGSALVWTNNYSAGSPTERHSPYSFKGDQSQQRTFNCTDFTNGTWNFSHGGQAIGGTPTALPGTPINCIILSQAYRGDPTSDFYGYHFVTDVNQKYFLAIKEGTTEAVKVGGVPSSMQFAQNDVNHDGITSFSFIEKNAISLVDNSHSTLFMTSFDKPTFLKLPLGMKHVEIYSLEGKLLWSSRNQSESSNDGFLRLPALAQTGAVSVRYLP